MKSNQRERIYSSEPDDAGGYGDVKGVGGVERWRRAINLENAGIKCANIETMRSYACVCVCF